jgi:small conductance mechanosensitive channel
MEEALGLDRDTIQNIYNTVAEFLVNYSSQVLGAIIILILGWILARWLSAVVVRFCNNKGVDVRLARFIGSCSYLLLLACFVIIALGNFGIFVAPFVAAVGALTLGAGEKLFQPQVRGECAYLTGTAGKERVNTLSPERSASR